MPVLGTIIFFGLSILNKHPQIFNYMVSITEENASRQYGYVVKTIRFLKFSIIATFNLVVVFTYLTAVGKVDGFGLWFLPFMFGLLLIPTAYYLFKSVKAK